MATWAKDEIELKDGTKVAVQMLVIVSACTILVRTCASIAMPTLAMSWC